GRGGGRMSEDTQITGNIRIHPPIPAAEITTSLIPLGPRLPFPDFEVALRIVEDHEPEITSDGIVVRRHADAIIPERPHQSARHLVEDIQAIVDRWGAGRTFTGHLHC